MEKQVLNTWINIFMLRPSFAIEFEILRNVFGHNRFTLRYKFPSQILSTPVVKLLNLVLKKYLITLLDVIFLVFEFEWTVFKNGSTRDMVPKILSDLRVIRFLVTVFGEPFFNLIEKRCTHDQVLLEKIFEPLLSSCTELSLLNGFDSFFVPLLIDIGKLKLFLETAGRI